MKTMVKIKNNSGNTFAEYLMGDKWYEVSAEFDVKFPVSGVQHMMATEVGTFKASILEIKKI